MKVKYENNFSIESNALIFLYATLAKLQTNQNPFIRKTAVIGSLVFKRVAFSLLVNKRKMLVSAKIKGMKFRARSTNSQFHSIYFDEYRNCYEPDVYGAIENFLPNGGTMLDVGSNWGHHTFDAAVRKDAKVFAFEPNVDVFDDLSRIVSDLNLEQRVVPYNFGLGSENGDLTLSQIGFESGVGSIDSDFVSKRVSASHLVIRIFDKLTLKKPIAQSVKIKVLDDFFDPNTAVDFIKIDCEGSELSVLKGALSLIERDKPNIVFELHTDNICSNYTAFIDFFEPIGYQLSEIYTDVDSGTWDAKVIETLLPNTQYNCLAQSKSKN